MFKDYDSIQVGDVASLVKKITMADIQRFVQMTGDNNPLHVDRGYAEGTPFKDIVAHGMLGASFVSTIIGTQLPGDGALWVSQSFDFLLPVRLDDTLHVSCKVIKKNDRERILDLETTILNQHKQLVLSGQGKVKVLAQKAPEAPKASTDRLKVAIVSGGAGGIGRAICAQLASQGYGVVVSYLTHAEKAHSVVEAIMAKGGKALAVKANVANRDEVQELVEQTKQFFGGISLLVNNASPKIHPKAFSDLEWSEIEEHLQVQLKGAYHLAKACLPEMKSRGHGKIINITSQAIDGTPTPQWTPYVIGKSALAAFSKSLAVELAPSGITVNCISPGMTDTALISDISEKARLMIARQNPSRRLAHPDDIAKAVGFLASEGADYINGETLRINGGQVML